MALRVVKQRKCGADFLSRTVRKHFQNMSSAGVKPFDTTNIGIYMFKSMVRRRSARFLRVVTVFQGALKTFDHLEMAWGGVVSEKFLYICG